MPTLISPDPCSWVGVRGEDGRTVQGREEDIALWLCMRADRGKIQQDIRLDGVGGRIDDDCLTARKEVSVRFEKGIPVAQKAMNEWTDSHGSFSVR